MQAKRFELKKINIGWILKVALIIIPLIIFHTWTFKLGVLTHGDWIFYFRETQLEFFNLPQIWSPSGLGGLNIGLPLYLSTVLFGASSYVSNFALSERLIYLWPSLFIPPIASYVLLKKLFKNSISAFSGSLIYSYNSYFLIGKSGHINLMIAFAIAPLIIYYFVRTLEEKKIRLLIITSLLSVICSAYEFRAFYIVLLILFLYYLFSLLLRRDLSFKTLLSDSIYAATPIAIVFLINIFWILGFANVGALSSNELFSRGLFGDQFMNISRSITLFHPFWTGTEYTPFVVSKIPIYYWITPILAFLGLALNARNRNVQFFSLIALIGIFLSKQSDIPFPFVYEWLYNNFPGFNAFRESSKFYFLTALGYSVLIAAFINRIWHEWNKNKIQIFTKYFLTITISFIFLWNLKPIATGELKTLFVERKIPDEYIHLKEFLVQQPEFFRTLWIPTDSRWGFYSISHPKISMANNYGIFSDEVEQTISMQQQNFNGNYLLDNASVKYIIIPIQDSSNDDNFFVHYNEREYYLNAVSNLQYLQKIKVNTGELIIYENSHYKPHVYRTDELETITKLVPFYSIIHEPISPTHYKIRLTSGTEPFYLNFTDSFHPRWALFNYNFKWYDIFLRTKNKPILGYNHLESDSGLNTFYINPQTLCDSTPQSCDINSEGEYNITLTLYFTPQSYVYLGFIISIITFGFCLIALLSIGRYKIK